jgi:hypothetical protein
MRFLIIGFAALAFAGAASAHTEVNINPPVPAFWQRVAKCETDGRWDWGKYAYSPLRRAGEGSTFEGGLGFYAPTWTLWRTEIHVPYAHAWQAPPIVQARVAAWGFEHGGYWGCLHDGVVDPNGAPSYASVAAAAAEEEPPAAALQRVARILESV